MELLNRICYGSAFILVGSTLIVLLITLAISVYSCFTKKIEGKLLSKIAVSLIFACVCPWFIKLLFFIWKRMVM